MARRVFRIILIVAISLATLTQPVRAASNAQHQSPSIVWAVDVSGSMATADSQRYWEEAVSLGVDLVPTGAKVAYFAANYSVVAQTSLSYAELPATRLQIKQELQGTKCTGYTNFNVALSGALELFSGAPAENRHLFFVADISEGGYELAGNPDYLQEMSELEDIGLQLASEGIKVHLLFLGEAPKDSPRTPLWEELASRTGGELVYVDDPSQLPRTVEDMYFEQYTYNMSTTTGVNTTDSVQDIPVKMPSFDLDRARIYVSTSSPLPGIQLRGDGTGLELTQSRSYSMIEITKPFSKNVELALPPSGNIETRVYFIADAEMSLSAGVSSGAEEKFDEQGAYYRQKSTITLSAVASGSPLFSDNLPADLDWSLTATDPLGNAITLEIDNARCRAGDFVFDYYPLEFGKYTFTLSAVSGGIQLSEVTELDISSIELPVVEIPVVEEPRDYTLWIACGIGAFLVIAACVFFALSRRRRRQDLIYGNSAADAAPDELPKTFVGKLDIYGIVIDSGKTEIPPTSFRLERIAGKKWVRLSTVFESCGIPYRYKEAEDIRFHPQSGGVLLVKNHSNAVFFRNGQAYHSGQQATFVFGQKIYVVFEEGVNEFEIYYHNSVETTVSGDRIHLEFSE